MQWKLITQTALSSPSAFAIGPSSCGAYCMPPSFLNHCNAEVV